MAQLLKIMATYKTKIAVAALILFAAALRLPGLRELPFFLDEQLHTHQAIELLKTGSVSYTRAFMSVTLPISISFWALGISWFKARLPMLILNSLAIIPLYQLLKRSGKAYAWIAILLFTINPWMIAAGRMAREYAVLPLFVFSAALIARNAYFSRANKWAWAAAAIFAGYLIFFDARGFLIFSLILYFLTLAFEILHSNARIYNGMRIYWWFLGIFFVLVLVIARVFMAQKATDIGDALPYLKFDQTYLLSITQSSVRHAYNLPVLGWLLFGIVLLNLRFWIKKNITEPEFLRAIFSAGYILAFIFLSLVLGSNGFSLRTRYEVLLEALSIPIWAFFLVNVFRSVRIRNQNKLLSFTVAGMIAVLFINVGGISEIYGYKGGPSFTITGINHFRNKEAYDYLTRKLKPGDTVMMDRFYYNNEMYGYQWPEIRWVQANKFLTDNTVSIGDQMPDIDDGWVVLYPEALADTFGFELNKFDSGKYHFKYHGKFGDTYIWHWTIE